MPHDFPFQFASLTARLRPVWPAVRTFGRGLLNLALPARCMLCDDDLSPDAEISLCLKCMQALAPELGLLPAVRRGPAGGIPSRRTMPACKDFPLKFDAVYPLGLYQGVLRDLVLKTKRLSEEALSMAVGRLLAQTVREKLADFNADAVAPIPMHWAKRLYRGVNSPEILAECLGRRLGVPVVRTLVRCRYTNPQKDLLPRERFRNVRGAFRLRRSDRHRWQNSRLLLVDDILTTGATCSEAAGLLKQAGAAAVAVAVVARADGS